MKCPEVKKRLVDLLARECRPSEEAAVRAHLNNCPGCSRELEDLKAVNSLLDSLGNEQAPPGLLEDIMKAVGETRELVWRPGIKAAGAGTGRPRKAVLAGTVRDMAVAAAAALVFWIGTGWLGLLPPAESNILSDAVFSYVRYTGEAVSMAGSSMSSINDGFLSAVNKFSSLKN